jgi:hypothetical protein
VKAPPGVVTSLWPCPSWSSRGLGLRWAGVGVFSEVEMYVVLLGEVLVTGDDVVSEVAEELLASRSDFSAEALLGSEEESGALPF